MEEFVDGGKFRCNFDGKYCRKGFLDQDGNCECLYLAGLLLPNECRKRDALES